jgi:hypothetical protein
LRELAVSVCPTYIVGTAVIKACQYFQAGLFLGLGLEEMSRPKKPPHVKVLILLSVFISSNSLLHDGHNPSLYHNLHDHDYNYNLVQISFLDLIIQTFLIEIALKVGYFTLQLRSFVGIQIILCQIASQSKLFFEKLLSDIFGRFEKFGTLLIKFCYFICVKIAVISFLAIPMPTFVMPT